MSCEQPEKTPWEIHVGLLAERRSIENSKYSKMHTNITLKGLIAVYTFHFSGQVMILRSSHQFSSECSNLQIPCFL